ncbi:recombination protein O N-terminal domain-containing protein [Mammaliicoccus sciuri]
MLYKQEGFVIRSVDYGENNKIITILNEHGHKVPLMARGAKKQVIHYKVLHSPLYMACLFFRSLKEWVHYHRLILLTVIERCNPIFLKVHMVHIV